MTLKLPVLIFAVAFVVILPVAEINPPVKILPPVILPDVLNAAPVLPVNTLAPLIVKLVSVAPTTTLPR